MKCNNCEAIPESMYKSYGVKSPLERLREDKKYNHMTDEQLSREIWEVQNMLSKEDK